MNISFKTPYRYLQEAQKYIPLVVTIGITLVIVINGHKFVKKPQQYYSINHDFREISNIDYHQMYGIVKKTIAQDPGQVAMIDTWPDRSVWYLGQDFPNLYQFRWQNEPGIISGHTKKTDFTLNQNGEKQINPRLRYVGEVTDLKKAMQRYPKGFIYIDDATMPKDVIDYAEKNLKKELYLDHYPLDDNPYSIWPATLYSWGME